jgi:hypothetical protein
VRVVKQLFQPMLKTSFIYFLCWMAASAVIAQDSRDNEALAFVLVNDLLWERFGISNYDTVYVVSPDSIINDFKLHVANTTFLNRIGFRDVNKPYDINYSNEIYIHTLNCEGKRCRIHLMQTDTKKHIDYIDPEAKY